MAEGGRTGTRQKADTRHKQLNMIALRAEGVSSERRWNDICASFNEEAIAADEGHDTLYNERLNSHSPQGTSMRNTIMNVEDKIATEKRTFFRATQSRNLPTEFFSLHISPHGDCLERRRLLYRVRTG